MAFGVQADGSDKSGRLRKAYIERPDEWPRIFAQERVGVVESSTVISHPKITPAPVVKRKLGSIKWDIIHEGIQGRKRDEASCPSDYQSCPASLNGGCCPNDRECGASSCFAKGAAPASACGKTGYIACGVADGGEYFGSYVCLIGANGGRWLLSNRLCLR
jgi:hypothetical protein